MRGPTPQGLRRFVKVRGLTPKRLEPAHSQAPRSRLGPRLAPAPGCRPPERMPPPMAGRITAGRTGGTGGDDVKQRYDCFSDTGSELLKCGDPKNDPKNSSRNSPNFPTPKFSYLHRRRYRIRCASCEWLLTRMCLYPGCAPIGERRSGYCVASGVGKFCRSFL